jgi:hypothetical protein
MAMHHIEIYQYRAVLFGDMAEEAVDKCCRAAHKLFSWFDAWALHEAPVGPIYVPWWAAYFVFTALTFYYVWKNHPTRDVDDGFVDYFDKLAGRCVGHLARDKVEGSLSRRYCAITQELREVMKRASPWNGQKPQPPTAGEQKGNRPSVELQEDVLAGSEQHPPDQPQEDDLGIKTLLINWSSTDWRWLDSVAYTICNDLD